MAEKTPFLTPLHEFLADIRRSYTWYRKWAGQMTPDGLAVPQLVKQHRENFVVTAQGDAYKRALLRKHGIATVGRPPKTAA